MAKLTRKVRFYRCERCTYQWQPREGHEPKICPTCKSPYWNEKRAKKPKVVATAEATV